MKSKFNKKNLILFSILFMTLLSLYSVNAELNSTLNSPSDNYTINYYLVPFSCTGADLTEVRNVTLLIDGIYQTAVFNTTAGQKILGLTHTSNLANGDYNWTCRASNSSATTVTGVYRTLTVNYPTETRDIMTSTGAGLGIILQYLGTSLFPLLIVFMIVGIIVVIGYSIVSAVKGNFSLRNR